MPNIRAIDARYPFIVGLRQGAIDQVFIDFMAKRKLSVDRPTTIDDFEVLPDIYCDGSYPIKVTLKHLLNINESQIDQNEVNNSKHTIRNSIVYTKYVIGCDGAHSWVRKKLGFTMDGDQTGYVETISFMFSSIRFILFRLDAVWGMLDSAVETDFPDIRTKGTVKSPSDTCKLIPREHDLVRFYIQYQVKRFNKSK